MKKFLLVIILFINVHAYAESEVFIKIHNRAFDENKKTFVYDDGKTYLVGSEKIDIKVADVTVESIHYCKRESGYVFRTNKPCKLTSEKLVEVYLTPEEFLALKEKNEKIKKQAEKEAQKYNEPTESGRGSVSFDEEGFVLRQDQKSLKYINSKDDIPGRYLYDQEDVTEDYQVHIIYLLAKDSKDKKWDAKGTIQKIVLNSNKKLKKRIKKQFRLDMTKEGKVDVSFVRVDKTKKQINAGDAATYFSRQIIKNGFYHPKKTYAIFYQDRYQQEWGQVGQGVFITPKGMIEVRTGVTYLGKESIGEAYVPYIHEMIHALGFVQHCAPCREKSGTDSHCYLGLDIMSQNGDSGKRFFIDKKSNEYYGHSNANCQMDMKKSVFLEPTEKDAQLKPRAPNNSECRVSLSQKIYNHERALTCLNRLDF